MDTSSVVPRDRCQKRRGRGPWRAAALTVAATSSVAVATFVARVPPDARPEVASYGEDPTTSAIWPAPAATLLAPAPTFGAASARRRVFVDAGHGADGNTGNLSSLCVDEQDFTLRLAESLATRLVDTGRFHVRVSRSGSARVPYRDRVAAAEAWGAEVFLSLHSDVRGRAETWSPRPGATCRRSFDAPGFSVLWSDEGHAPLLQQRQALARQVGGALRGAGLLPYGGEEYRDLYAADDSVPGVFVDRHAPAKRIFVLRAPAMPSVLIETHNAWDPREATRWREPATLDAFASAVAGALAHHLTVSAPAHAPDPPLPTPPDAR